MLLNCGVGLLRVPWTARRSNQSILKEINPEYSVGRTDDEAEALRLQLSDAKTWLIRKDPDAGKDWRQEEKKGMSWLEDITESIDLCLSKLQEKVKDREAWHAAVCGIAKSQTWLSDWTSTIVIKGRLILNNNKLKAFYVLTALFNILNKAEKLYPSLWFTYFHMFHLMERIWKTQGGCWHCVGIACEKFKNHCFYSFTKFC